MDGFTFLCLGTQGGFSGVSETRGQQVPATYEGTGWTQRPFTAQRSKDWLKMAAVAATIMHIFGRRNEAGEVARWNETVHYWG